MLASGFRYLIRVAALALAAGFVFTSLSAAQTPTSKVDQFLANPAQVLSQYPSGGSELISLVRDTIVAHPDALKTIIALLPNANSDQQLAIGSGAGQANRIVNNTDQNLANTIASAIAGSGSGDAQAGFSGATGNVSISATGASGPGGGGGDGGGGGGGIGGPTAAFGVALGGNNSGASGPTGAQSSPTSTQTFTGGGAGVSGSTSSGSVSPH